MEPFAPHESIEVAVAVVLLLGLGVAASFGRSRGRLVVAWTLAIVSQAVPWLCPADQPFVRFLLSLTALLFFVRVWDLSTDRRDHDFKHRLWFLFTPFDTRKCEPTKPAVSGRLLGGVVFYSGITTAAFCAVAYWTPYTEEPGGLALRWMLGLAGSYAMAESANYLFTQTYLAVGIRAPVFHRTPILARTIAEFWGERWNLEVNRVLRQRAFLPLARRRLPTLAIAAGFFGSVLIHVWIMIPAGGFLLAGVWGVYFGLHGLFVIVERRLGVGRWPDAAARAWTVGLFVLSGPAFVEPFLRITVG